MQMASRKPRWKLSFSSSSHRRSTSSSPSSSPSSSITTKMPVEFLCPISRSIMADPVIVPSGQTFERSCIQACAELAFTPPGLGLDLDLSSSAAASLVFFPNNALKSAIFSWCQRSGLPPPLPFPREAALAFVRRLMPPADVLPPSVGPLPSSFGARIDKEEVLAPPAFSSGGQEVKDGILREPEFAYLENETRNEVSPAAAATTSYFDVEDEKAEVLRASGVSNGGQDVKDGAWRLISRGSDENLNESPMSPVARSSPVSVRTMKKAPPFSPLSTTTSSSSHHSTSSYSSSEMVAAEETLSQDNPRAAIAPPASYVAPPSPAGEVDVLEEEILTKLSDYDISEHESAAAAVRQATRESPDRRKALCTPSLLAALRPMLLSRSVNVQINAAAAMVNLSLETANKVRIVRSGAVPPLVDVLRSGHPEARDHAAGALFSLALQDENRAAIGVLGAIPPLLNLFARPNVDGPRARHDAGMALYHLSLATTNRSKIARTPGAVRALLSVAAEREEASQTAQQQRGPRLARLAMMIVCNLAGCQEGRDALMNGGAVAAVVGLMRGPPDASAEEYCVAALYGMSRGSLRFRGLARAAGAERVLMRVAEGSVGGGGEVRREMARKTLRTMRGEDDEEGTRLSMMEFPADGDGSVVSEGLMSFPRRYKNHAGVSAMNSAEF